MGRLLWEMLDRSATGPIMREETFETELFPTVMADVQAKHRIEWDPDEPIMADPDMADAIFRAGVELLLEVGLFCKDTNRIVKLSEAEVQEVIASAKHEVTLGADRDAITLRPRAPGDRQHPYTFFPAGALTRNIDTYRLHALVTAQEPTCDGLIPIPLFGVGDLKQIPGTPAQTLVCLKEAQIMNEVANWVGRPGLFLGIPMSATTPLTLMSAFGSGLYHKHNCTMPVQILQDMRINYDRFNQAFYAQQHGIEPWMSSSPTLYAYLTGAEHGAIEIIAHTLGMMAYSGGTLTQAMSLSVHGSYTGNDITWCNSAAALAAERNLKLPWVSFGSTADPLGAMSDDAWYGTAVACITACISGMEGLWLAGGATGLESRWAGEIARAAAGLGVADGIELIKTINAMDRAPNPRHARLEDLYEMETLRPRPEYLERYRAFTKTFRALGLDYPTWN